MSNARELAGFLKATSNAQMPRGTTAQRPGTPVVGMIRYNNTLNVLEQYTLDGWTGIEPPPTITSIVLPSPQTAVSEGDTVTINGSNFKSNSTVKFVQGGVPTDASSYSYINSTQMTGVVPAGLTDGNVGVKVTNPSGLAATADGAVAIDGVAIFNEAAGSLGTFLDYASVNVDAGATEDGSAVTTYAIQSGALPTGLTLNTSTGAITGQLGTNVSADTTFNFTVRATDSENQTADRAFSILVQENYQPDGSIIFDG